MEQRPNEQTLIRFFRGQCTPAEERAVRLYLAMDTDEDYVTDCLRAAFPDLEREHDPTITVRELDRVWNGMTDRGIGQLRPQPRRLRRWYPYAAAVIVLVLAGLGIFRFPGKQDNYTDTEIVWQEVSAPIGRMKTILLPDSSMAYLFPGTTLEIADNYNGSDRQVRLDGRAFFEVAKQPMKPFTVASGPITTKVLGTVFEVVSSRIEQVSTVILHEGSVAVSRDGEELARLQPRQRLRYDNAEDGFTVADVGNLQAPLWLSGELAYEQEPLRNVFSDMEKWYGVEIAVSDPQLLGLRVTTGFRNLPIDRVMGMITKSTGLDYIRDGNRIMVSGKKGGLRRQTAE